MRARGFGKVGLVHHAAECNQAVLRRHLPHCTAENIKPVSSRSKGWVAMVRTRCVSLPWLTAEMNLGGTSEFQQQKKTARAHV